MTPPTHEEIEAAAYELYQQRLAAGTAGDELGDWYEAEQQLASEPETTQ